jgi:hypothetical protein
MTGFAASAWAESRDSSETCGLAWDDVPNEGGAGGRAVEDKGNS